MTANQTSTGIARFVRALRAHDGAHQTDGQLVSRFLARRDEAAFVALVRRHGPMVLGVCRRVLGDGADAEDAFQATFLVLVRKAASLTGRAVLGDWLHGVARRTALSARRACARRRAKEQAMARQGMPRADVQGETIPDETVWDDWLPLLDEELSRLPEKYRLAIVLCDLEGKTRREAADRLGWPEGTVAGRLARGRALLAKRLARRGGVLSSSAVATMLAHGAASACVSETLLHCTARAASLLAAGTAAGTGATAVISARVAALTDGVVRAMLLAKLKTVTCAVALMVIVGLGGVALVPGRGAGFQPADATPPQTKKNAERNSDAQHLVRQLGSTDFARRLAAEKALTDLGARAAAAVQAGTKDADPEIAKRCEALWPRLWQTEIARPDVERLAGYAHPLWARFRKVAGDGPGSRTLYAEMVSDLGRYNRLEAVEADPGKAGAAYAAELKERNQAIERGAQEAMEKFRFMTGPIIPTSGFPTRPEFITVLFLGIYPATAKDQGGDLHHNVFAPGIGRANDAAPPIRSAFRRLYATWLAMRTAPQPLQIGLRLAYYHGFAEVLPTALVHAANDKLDPTARGFALLVVGRVGSAEHLPLVEKAFTDARVYHMNNFTFKDGKSKAIETRVSDTAIAAALRLAKQDPADFGFTFMEMYRGNSMRDATEHSLLGFFQDDDAARQAAHKRAKAWLDEHRKGQEEIGVDDLATTPVVKGAARFAADQDDAPPDLLIGYTELRTDLPGGRHANEKTRRAVVVKADGTGRRVLAEELTREPGWCTQFVGWSPDGKAARLSRDWKSDENGKWEEEHKTFLPPTAKGIVHETYLVELASGKATKQTPREDKKASTLVKSLVHGRSISPDGKRSAFEDPVYRLFLADADGANPKQIQTGLRFHLMPSWSPDGAWVLFVAGEHYDCHPHVIKADGTGLKKLASRNGYRGVIDYLDVYDFHDGSSDLPVWAPDSKSVFYTAKVGSNVELFRVTLDGKSQQLTETPAGSMHYHPQSSPDGKWLVYGSKRNGVRQLHVMRLSDKKEWRITDLAKGRAAMWPSWQPRAAMRAGAHLLMFK